MERLYIDADLPEKLRHLTHAVELIDGDGNLVAVVQPRLDPTRYEFVGAEVSDEELQRRCAPGRTTYPADEIVTRLRKLA